MMKNDYQYNVDILSLFYQNLHAHAHDTHLQKKKKKNTAKPRPSSLYIPYLKPQIFMIFFF